MRHTFLLALLLACCLSACQRHTELKTYQDANSGFSFQYPAKVVVGTHDYNQKDLLYLRVQAEQINSLSSESGMDAETAMRDRTRLSSGHFGETTDFAVTQSKQVLPIDDRFAKQYVVLQRFDAGDVTFERVLQFYTGQQLVTLTLYGRKNDIVFSVPEYFRLDTRNYGPQPIWRMQRQEEFYERLKAHRSSPTAQLWYDSFEDIVRTLQIKHVEEEKTVAYGYIRRMYTRHQKLYADVDFVQYFTGPTADAEYSRDAKMAGNKLKAPEGYYIRNVDYSLVALPVSLQVTVNVWLKEIAKRGKVADLKHEVITPGYLWSLVNDKVVNKRRLAPIEKTLFLLEQKGSQVVLIEEVFLEANSEGQQPHN